jgi:hypothetical protein
MKNIQDRITFLEWCIPVPSRQAEIYSKIDELTEEERAAVIRVGNLTTEITKGMSLEQKRAFLGPVLEWLRRDREQQRRRENSSTEGEKR